MIFQWLSIMYGSSIMVIHNLWTSINSMITYDYKTVIHSFVTTDIDYDIFSHGFYGPCYAKLAARPPQTLIFFPLFLGDP